MITEIISHAIYFYHVLKLNIIRNLTMYSYIINGKNERSEDI